MKKALTFSICFALLILNSNQSTFAAAPAPGTKCSKLGQIAVSNGNKYKCILVKKKLIWDKGISTLPKTQASTHAYDVNPKEIKTFADLKTQYKDIKYWAWKKSRQNIDRAIQEKLSIEVHVAPNSKDCSAVETPALFAIQNLYSGSELPNKAHLIYANQTEDDWTRVKLRTLLEDFQDSTPLQNPHGINKKFESVELQNTPCTSKEPMFLSGATAAHGYTHTIQKIPYMSSKENWGTFPRWIIEGGATFSENIVMYGKDYKTWITNPSFHNWDLKQYDLKFYQDFFQYKLQADGKYSWVHTDQWPNQRAYDVGSYACEVLIALKGPASIMKLNAEYARTGDFTASFEKIYGVPWDVAEPQIAEAVYLSTNWLINTPNGLGG